MTDEYVESLLALTYEHAQGGRPVAATDTLVQQTDRWLVEGEIERVRLVLEKLDPGRCPPEVLTGVLSLTWHAKEQLDPARAAFFVRAMEALDRMGLPSERLAKIAERLAGDRDAMKTICHPDACIACHGFDAVEVDGVWGPCPDTSWCGASKQSGPGRHVCGLPMGHAGRHKSGAFEFDADEESGGPA